MCDLSAIFFFIKYKIKQCYDHNHNSFSDNFILKVYCIIIRGLKTWYFNHEFMFHFSIIIYCDIETLSSDDHEFYIFLRKHYIQFTVGLFLSLPSEFH